MDTDCRPSASQVFTHDAAGADPNIPVGTDPGLAPAI
jgi:hypothetical protein